jgi:hypothetical protein
VPWSKGCGKTYIWRGIMAAKLGLNKYIMSDSEMRAFRYLPSLILFNSKWVYLGALSQQTKHSWEIPISDSHSDLHEDSSVLADRPCSLVNINDVSGDRGPSIFKIKQLKRYVPCTLGGPYTESTWSYCDYFIWCVSCTVVVLTGFVMCGCVYVWVL